MALLVIPFFNSPSFTEEITLEGTSYQFTFSWNSRGSFWCMDISDRDKSPLVHGIKLLLNYELLLRHPDRGLPPGRMYVADVNNTPAPISFDDMTNGRCQLLYVESV